MNEGDAFPSLFYSRAPLPERVTLINLKHGAPDQFYWMLSIENGSRAEKKLQGGRALAPYDDNDTELIDCCDLEDNYEINPTKSGKYITAFYAPNALHSVIIGPGGSKLHSLQDTNNTLIKVPKPQEAGLIKITGRSERSVASTRTQIALLLLAHREKLAITHFVSIPINSDGIRQNFSIFKNEILQGHPTRGIDEIIFQKVEKLHLTVVTLVLLDDNEIDEAKSVFKKCQSSLAASFSHKKPTIVMKGVEIMNDDPSAVDVLYGKVTMEDPREMEKLQEACDNIVDDLFRAGLVRRQYEKVKLHVTLMNSLFRKGEKLTKRESFDAAYIVDKYRNFHFGTTILDEIHLSVRFTLAPNGYYKSACTVSL